MLFPESNGNVCNFVHSKGVFDVFSYLSIFDIHGYHIT